MQSKMPFERAIELIDEANSRDPNRVQAGGREWPVELLYAQRMTDRLHVFEPVASVALQLAARAQHICRWQRPRSEYPMDRKGYHQWRTALYAFHADTAAPLLRDAGIDEPTIARVQSLLRKERLKSDPESQTLEDVICLVFLQFYWNDFSNQHDDEKLIAILRRTWAKMSPRGHASALELPLDERSLSLVQRALNP